MAYEENMDCITIEAGADLSAKQYYFVTMASDGQVDPTGDGAIITGVLQNKPDAAGKAATVAIRGVSKVVAGAAITRGAFVASDTNGKAVAVASGDYPGGQAMEAALADGDIIAVNLEITATPRA